MGTNRTPAQTKKLLRKRDGDLCCWCHERMLFVVRKTGEPGNPAMATIEHIVPLSEGGSRKMLSNMALAHDRCNTGRKGRARPPLPPMETRA